MISGDDADLLVSSEEDRNDAPATSLRSGRARPTRPPEGALVEDGTEVTIGVSSSEHRIFSVLVTGTWIPDGVEVKTRSDTTSGTKNTAITLSNMVHLAAGIAGGRLVDMVYMKLFLTEHISIYDQGCGFEECVKACAR